MTLSASPASSGTSTSAISKEQKFLSYMCAAVIDCSCLCTHALVCFILYALGEICMMELVALLLHCVSLSKVGQSVKDIRASIEGCFL